MKPPSSQIIGNNPHAALPICLAILLLPIITPQLQANPPKNPETVETVETDGPHKTPRDWEKFPPITDSDIIHYEKEKNIPVSDRFETIEKKSMEDWYKHEVLKTLLQHQYASPTQQKTLFKRIIKALDRKPSSPAHQAAMIQATFDLFDEIFPESNSYELSESITENSRISPETQQRIEKILQQYKKKD